MKFLLDQDVYSATERFLRDLGHDVARVRKLGPGRPTDAEILGEAHESGRVLVSRDRDFGQLVFAGGSISGVLYLRILPELVPAVHTELGRVISLYPQDELLAAFVTVEAGRHRFRKLGPTS